MEYKQIDNLPINYIKQKIADFLEEDSPTGDITGSSIFTVNEQSQAVIEAEAEMVFAGGAVLPCFASDTMAMKILVNDGDRLSKGSIIAEIRGSTAEILLKERVMLNLLQRLCGIATLTRRYVLAANNPAVQVLDTRKTTPGLRLFEKYAVKCGGGTNHRLDLSSGVLLKDNHIKAAGSITNAIQKMRKFVHDLPVEVEVENFDELQEAVEAKADWIMLDNMLPDNVQKAVEIVHKLTKKKIFIEASGGITLDTISEYAKTGVDAISCGALTHSAKSASIHLEFV